MRRSVSCCLSALALLLATLSLPSQAQSEPVGYVKTVVGEAWVSTAGQRVKAEPGTAVLLGSALRTGTGASMGVTFKDNTVMSFGPNTELTVDEYLYAPAQGQLKLSTRLVRGTLNYISGVIEKLKPEAVSVKTPTGIIGVRGTQFVASVDDQP
jgi:hypothetical protein